MVPWHSGGPVSVPDHDGSSKSLHRGVASMRRLCTKFALKPDVRQVRGSVGLVHLYVEKLFTLCNSWKCGSLDNPVAGAFFSSHPNEWDSHCSYGFCEKCYSESMFSRVAELRGVCAHQSILPVVSPSKVQDTIPSSSVLSPSSEPDSSSETEESNAS